MHRPWMEPYNAASSDFRPRSTAALSRLNSPPKNLTQTKQASSIKESSNVPLTFDFSILKRKAPGRALTA
jgi:hypothetical protein